jgi:hypothetical protein
MRCVPHGFHSPCMAANREGLNMFNVPHTVRDLVDDALICAIDAGAAFSWLPGQGFSSLIMQHLEAYHA